MEDRKINDKTLVNKQYKDDAGLLIRKKLHKNYSTNKQGFANWLFEIMALPTQGKILELGSGNGDFWKNNIDELSKDTHLTLSDFSSGMVGTIKSKFDNSKVDIKRIDIEDIPYENDTFDLVIANAMLYHVPQLNKALNEVERVLKPGGKFYASTFGENGLSDFISESLKTIGIKTEKKSNYTFTLQNGFDRLDKHFDQVKRLDYIDQLIIKDPLDLVDYIFSMTSMYGLTREDRQAVDKYFNDMTHDKGVIEIAKEYGSFISTKKL
jgi:ubiquinone/menaquinone biosynthesis C-methylase UbiE